MKSLIPFLLTLFLGISFWLEGQAKDTERPSVLLINVDDWNDWNSVLKGHSQAISPNIERFAKKGVTFSNAICASPSCVPSRPALFTGIAPSRSGNISNDSGKRPWRFYAGPETITIPKLFSQNGWESIGIAKNFHRGDAPEFDTYIPPFKTPKKLKKVGLNLNSSCFESARLCSAPRPCSRAALFRPTPAPSSSRGCCPPFHDRPSSSPTATACGPRPCL